MAYSLVLETQNFVGQSMSFQILDINAQQQLQLLDIYKTRVPRFVYVCNCYVEAVANIFVSESKIRTVFFIIESPNTAKRFHIF